jgi:hypothetical protein
VQPQRELERRQRPYRHQRGDWQLRRSGRAGAPRAPR